MSASALMSTGTAAIFAAYRQVQTTANNISNANTEGYSRQSVALQTARGELTGDGYIGRGVTVSTVTRATNQFLASQTNALTSASATDAVRADLQEDVKSSVAEVNGTTKALAKLNVQISNAANSGHAPNDLLDQRDLLIGRLSEQLDVHAVMGPDGQASVFLASGESLVLGNESNDMLALPDQVDPTRLRLGIQLDTGLTLLSRAADGEGRIPGLLKIQNDDLVA
ncbi:MAG: hypothetical protein CFE45_03670, partial [Burkholderiales bacterium PBB5]